MMRKRMISTTCLLQYVRFGCVHSVKVFLRLHTSHLQHRMYITLVMYVFPYLYFSRVVMSVRGSVQRRFEKTEFEMGCHNLRWGLTMWDGVWQFEMESDYLRWGLTIWDGVWQFVMGSDNLTWGLTIWDGAWQFEMGSDYLRWGITIWDGVWLFEMGYDYLRWGLTIWDGVWQFEMRYDYLRWGLTIWDGVWQFSPSDFKRIFPYLTSLSKQVPLGHVSHAAMHYFMYHSQQIIKPCKLHKTVTLKVYFETIIEYSNIYELQRIRGNPSYLNTSEV